MLILVGAVVLLVSLFLEWYDPGLSAWDSFEWLDLLLAALAVLAIAAVLARLGVLRAAANVPLTWLCLAALVIVTSQLIDEPPSVGEGDPRVGAWLALAAVGLMALGACISYARLSIALRVDRHSRSTPASTRRPTERPVEPAPFAGRSESTTRVISASDAAAGTAADPASARRPGPAGP